METHPFGSFLPTNTRFVLTGTFPGKQFSQRTAAENEADELAFSYGGRNQLWKIFERIFQVKLNTRQQKKDFLESINFGLTDLYLAVERTENSNLDSNLKIIITNQENLAVLFENPKIEQFFCTGIGVAKELVKWFPEHQQKIIALPSPSPAYRGMSFEKKVEEYTKILNSINVKL